MSLVHAAPALVPHPGVHSAVVRAAAPVVRLDSVTTEALVFRHSAAHSTIIYTVQPGDCLWTIAQKFYGSGGQRVRILRAKPKINHCRERRKCQRTSTRPGCPST